MGTGSTKGLWRSETISDTTNNINSTFVRSPIATVCGCFPRHSQCSAGTGETRWSIKEASPSILRLRSTKSIKKKLHRAGEGTICCTDGLQEVSTLFLVTPHYSTFIPTSQGYHKKKRSFRLNWKVGSRTQWVYHRLRSQIFHSISSISRFYWWLASRLIGRSNSIRRSYLDNLLWWFMGVLRAQCCIYHCFTIFTI